MRSYYSHLESTGTGAFMQRPILRASAIFPVFHDAAVQTRLLFLGYWFLKRHVSALTAIVVLRTAEGAVIWRTQIALTEARAYRLEVADLLAAAGHTTHLVFSGSVEIEFYSITNLVYPFPAVVVNYYGKDFSSVVHTAQRVYNDYEDMQNNSEMRVPEAGFNIYADADKEPVVALINGPEAVDSSTIQIECLNIKGEVLAHTLMLGNLPSYATRYLWLAREIPQLSEFLGGSAGTVRLSFDVRWIFPRLLVGNWQRKVGGLVVTHSYYDCSKATAASNYWYAPSDGWHWASLMLPLYFEDGAYTRISLYPIYSPCSFSIDCEVYTASGRLIHSWENLILYTPASGAFQQLDLSSLVRSLDNHDTKEPLAARLIVHPTANSSMPTRIKLAIDSGYDEGALPCNICTNVHLYNRDWENKTRSFKWAPILNGSLQAHSWIMNSSPACDYQQLAQLEITFYREQDTATLVRHSVLPAHGSLLIDPSSDRELAEFLDGKIGWFTVVTTNPYTTLYYFARAPHSIVGGDHGF